MTADGSPDPYFAAAPATAAEPDGLATASMILGVASFLPIPGAAAGLVAVILGLASGLTSPGGKRVRHRQATIGITLGAISLGILVTLCFVYFVVLGYPLPHIGRYHPSSHHVGDCTC